jgi:hypothetical protein
MPRKYSYYPSFDGKKAQPGTEKLADLCNRRWKTKNMGIYVARLMRNSHTEGKKIGDPGMEKWMSVHATGAAVDIGYDDRKVGVEMWDWFIKYTKELGIEEIHDYAFDKENFTQNINLKFWNWHEIQDADVKDISDSNMLEPFMQEDFTRAVWVCKIKK